MTNHLTSKERSRIPSLLAVGYVWREYVPAAQRIAEQRETIYANDNH